MFGMCCLHNVQLCFACDFLDVVQRPGKGMRGRGAAELPLAKQSHGLGAAHSHTLEFAQTQSLCLCHAL